MISRTRRQKHVQGVTLIELMIVVVIVAILAMIAMPSYTEYRLRTNRTEGQDCLLQVQRRMERYSTVKHSYTTNLTALGYTGLSNGAWSCGSDDLYRISVSAASTDCPTQTCYQLVATPQGSQAEDGAMRLTYLSTETDPNARSKKERKKDGAWVSWDQR